MNKAILIGNLTKDPELRRTAQDIAVCSYTLAINRPFTNAQGEREADFIPVVVWRQTAEFCARNLHKGSKVAVWGRIQTRTYDRPDGTRGYTTEVVVDEVQPLSPRPTTGYAEQGGEVPLPPPPPTFGKESAGGVGSADISATTAPAAPAAVEDDDLPF